jgi:hypothetical protein
MEPHDVAEGHATERQGPGPGPAGAGLASLGLGLAAHAASGGTLPSLLVLGGLAALAVLAATLLARVRMPGWAVMLVLGVAQQLLHWLLGGLAAAPSSTVPGADGHHGGQVPVGTAVSGGHSPEVMLMLHTHLAAALLVGWVVLRHRTVLEWLRNHRRRRGAPENAEGASAT